MSPDDYYRQRGLEHLKTMVSLANEGLKALVLINGGAVVALLTFLGNAKFGGSGAARFAGPMALFALGVVAALVGYIMAYRTQYVLHNEERPEREGKVCADANGKPLKAFAKGAHSAWQARSAYCVFASLAFLCAGSGLSIDALTSVDMPPVPSPVVRVECALSPDRAPSAAIPMPTKAP